MRRREFISALGGAAVWPLTVRAQQAAMPVIGLLQLGTSTSYDLTRFYQGLKDAGYTEGQNLAIERRFAHDDPNRLAQLAAELTHRNVRVIVSIASAAAVSAAKAATGTIPVVFGFGGDPIALGFVESLNRPGGNVTGMTSMSSELVGKQLGILHELLPQATCIGLFSNPKNLLHVPLVKDAQAAASAIGVTIEVLTASAAAEIDTGMMYLAKERQVQGLVISNDPLFIEDRTLLIGAALRYRLPAIYPFRSQTEAGGLMSYGPDLAVRDRDVGRYVGRILNGEKPADLPVMQSTKFEFVINLKTAKALGVTFSAGRLAIADEVIE